VWEWHVITTADLRWRLDLAPTLDWTFAKTYAQSAPHDYVVLGRNACPLTRDDFVRVAKVIATFGSPAKFYSMTGNYLMSPDGGTKCWTMDAELTATDLINRATTDRVYGVQDAPSTDTPCWVEADAHATDYDEMRNREHDEAIRAAIMEHFGERSPRTLDVGCGTGALVDLGVQDPNLYTGLDESKAMLNMLVRKQPGVGRLIPSRFPTAPELEDVYELVTAIDVPGIDVAQLQSLSSDLVIVAGSKAVWLLRGTGRATSAVAG
jgi:hypothetical protein